MLSPPSDSTSVPPPVPRIAVIALHGVADQAPNTSNAAVASLLAQHASQDTIRGDEADVAPSATEGAYTSFATHELHLPQHPVRVASDPAMDVHPPKPSWWTVWSQREYLAEARRALAAGSPDPEGELGYRFMRMLLREHTPGVEARTYATTMLRSTRRHAPPPTIPVEAIGDTAEPSPDPGPRRVDVFEVYWADLSRPTRGVLGFLGTTYQLTLHLATLGRQAVEDASVELRGWPWRLLQRVQQGAVWLLTVPVVLLNLLLLVVAFGVIPAGAVLNWSLGPLLTSLLLGGLVGGGAVYHWGRRDVPRHPLGWSLVPVGGALLGATLMAAVHAWAVPAFVRPVDVVSLGWLAIGMTLLLSAARAYQRLRTGAVLWMSILLVLTAALFGFWRWHYGGLDPDALDGKLLDQATLSTVQGIYIALRAVWVLVLVSLAGLMAAWWAAWATTPRQGAAWARGRAALRTGRLGIALSASAFLAVSLPIWAGVYAYSTQTLHAFSNHDLAYAKLTDYPRWAASGLPTVAEVERLDHRDARLQIPRTRPSLSPSAYSLAATDDSEAAAAQRVVAAADSAAAAKATADAIYDSRRLQGNEYLNGLMSDAVTTAFPLSLALGLLAFGLLVWMAFPSIRAEGDLSEACSNLRISRLGQWLSRGLDATRWVTHLMVAACLVVLVGPLVVKIAAGVGSQWPGAGQVKMLNEDVALALYQLVSVTGGLLSASALALFGLVSRYGGSALDVVLDVDNYLRTAPRTSTPRARIVQRYAAVLRHIASDDADGQRRYDGVVIVAHSLGALITAELLRYLVRERALGGDRTLTRLGYGPIPTDGPDPPPEIPITLVTMGNPLRQLLARFFPHRYQWVCETPDNGTRPLSTLDHAVPVASGAFLRPDASALGVRHWENLYRTGDYVGRSLWLDEWYRRNTGGDARPSGGSPPARLARVVAGGNGAPTVAEACIGNGAHTHYWDTTAPDVAERIDALISVADRPLGA